MSALCSFFLAMLLYPDVQKKAQAELDRVVGNDRLPNFNDRERLPYIDALVKETLRWNPVVPLCKNTFIGPSNGELTPNAYQPYTRYSSYNFGG